MPRKSQSSLSLKERLNAITIKHRNAERALVAQIGYRVKAARLRARLTQQMLGDMIRMTRVEISRIETGRVVPPLSKLVLISVMLNYPLTVRFKMKPRASGHKTKFRKKPPKALISQSLKPPRQ